MVGPAISRMMSLPRPRLLATSVPGARFLADHMLDTCGPEVPLEHGRRILADARDAAARSGDFILTAYADTLGVLVQGCESGAPAVTDVTRSLAEAATQGR